MNPIVRFIFSFFFGLLILHLIEKSGLFDNYFYVEQVKIPAKMLTPNHLSNSPGTGASGLNNPSGPNAMDDNNANGDEVHGLTFTSNGNESYSIPPIEKIKDELIKSPNNYDPQTGFRKYSTLQEVLNFPQLTIDSTNEDKISGFDLNVTAWSVGDDKLIHYTYDKIKKEDLDIFLKEHEQNMRKSLSVAQLAQYKDKIEKVEINYYYKENDPNTPPVSFAYTVYFNDIKNHYSYGPFSMVFYDNDLKTLKDELPADVYQNINYHNLPLNVNNNENKIQVTQEYTVLGRIFQMLFGFKDYIFSNLVQILFIFAILFSSFMMFSQIRNLQKSQVDVLQPEQIEGDMNDLIGMEDIKKEVLQLKDMYNNRSLYKEHGINRPFNLMFSGPPGVGKTKIASYLAKEMGLPIIFASASNLETGLVGGGSGMLKKIYHRASELGKVIVFLDEAQPLLMKRGQQTHKWADDTSNALLSLLDGVHTSKNSGIISIVASNFDEEKIQMDEAMLRRFQLKINFRLPNCKEREAILKSFLVKKESKYIKSNLDLSYLAEVTEGLSPAILNTIMDKASFLAIESKVIIDEDLLMQAFERTVIGLTDRQTTEERLKDRRIISIHELGHFFVRFHQYYKGNLEETKKHIPVLKISTEAVSKSNALGYVLLKQDKDMLLNREELEDKIMCLYGGMANEEIFFGHEKLTTGAYDDVKKITNLLKHMVVDLSMYSKKKINYALLAGELKEVQNDQVKEMEKISEDLYSKTVEVLKKYTKITDFITPILMEKYVLTIEEIFKIIDEKIDLIKENVIS